MSKEGETKPSRTVEWITANYRTAARVIIGCTRALLLAHFDTAGAGSKVFLGASDRHLQERLRQEGLHGSDWQQYEQVWTDCGAGRSLDKRDGVYTLHGRRSARGAFAAHRPGVFSITEHLLGDVIPRPTLTDWYRFDLQKRYDLVDSSEFVAFALEWLSKFNEIRSGTISRQQLFALNDKRKRPIHPKWTEALVESLEFLAVLQFTKSDLAGYKIKLTADPAFVLCNLFGRSTGSEGLDYLLYGGLWVPGGVPSIENLSVVVSGPPGVGKSTLALGMAVQVAARGGLALLFYFEPNQANVRRKIAQFYRSYEPFFRLRLGNLEASPNTSLPPDLRLISASDIVTGPAAEIQNIATRVAAIAGTEVHGERIVVFDSISAAQGYGTDKTEWRSFFYETTAILRKMGYLVVYVMEGEPGGRADFEDYVVDVDFQLRRDEELKDNFSFRSLEIVKSRLQPSHRGNHIYSIETDAGLRLYPSSAAVGQARVRREARVRYQEHKLIDPGVTNFAVYLGRVPNERTAVSWWREGSVTALVGPHGLWKTLFADAFARTLPTADYGSGCSISLQFADEFQAFQGAFTRESQRLSSFGVRYDVRLSPPGEDGLFSTLSYILFRPGYLAPGCVLQTVRDLIAEKRKQQLPIRRAVISDASALSSSFPALKDDPIFLPSLCALFTSEGITTVVPYSRPQSAKSGLLLE